MKKLVAILLCLMLVCCLAVPAFAAGASISLSASGTTLQRGDTVTITVNFSSSENIKTASLSSLNFNSSVFEAVSGTCNKSICDFGNYNKDRVGIAMVWEEEGKYSGQMGTITLKVKNDAPLGTYTISGSPVFKNGNNEVSGSCNSVTITVSCNHSWGAWSNAGNDGHTRTCTKCQTPETVAHTWDNGKQTAAPTCAKVGTKTYTCTATGCGATKTEDIPKLTTHTWGNWEKDTDAKHKHTCTVEGCGVSETQDHKWDGGKVTKPATCAAPGEKTFTCSVCKGTKVEPTDPSEGHTLSKWEKISDTQHKRSCTISGCSYSETKDHSWNTGTVTKAATCAAPGEKTLTCKDCGGTKIEPIAKLTTHTWGKWETTGDSEHKRTCTVANCGVFETKGHEWNKGTVTKAATCKEDGVRTFTCTGCGATKTEKIDKLTTHAWGKWTEVDAANHKRTCTVCGDGVSETKAHGFATKYSYDKNQHWYACTDCGAKKDAAAHTPGAPATETTAQRCTVCNYIIKAALGHTHKWDTKYTTDGENHWYACSGCNEKKDAKAHDFANDCDGLCETCQYTRETTHKFGTDWTSDASGHWHACTVCGEKTDAAEHAPGVEATETTAQTCTACGFELAPALGHTHVFGETWEKDEVNHWHVCACGEKADEAAHEWNDQGACPTCLAQKPAEPESNSFPWWIILVAVLGIGVVVAIVVIAKKKKK